MRGDEEAASSLRGVIVQPMQILCRQCRVDAGVARRAVAYPDSTVFFLDDAATPDPTSFWIGCGHFSRIVVQPSGVAGRGHASHPERPDRERPHAPIARVQPPRRARTVGRADDRRARRSACGCRGRAAHVVRELRGSRHRRKEAIVALAFTSRWSSTRRHSIPPTPWRSSTRLIASPSTVAAADPSRP